jgi:hypothetical protein
MEGKEKKKMRGEGNFGSFNRNSRRIVSMGG